ncbi:neocarzinostatin apoprotein domain-containing protein [Corynebacterium aquilae]|uniref:Thiamine biosynthesis protein n=1 Tax=Corynebacterium aquilae DSM 44791 TaxID=1431546 RepID=A0A1L7CH97_9CORY|nr:neocarzinostatin apoprotein domain-containing protein [Corynebacterium aquilae]APT85227.1 hypothetical protein CAQU_09250 [Corynebacterium aquilae DSM 44791]
MTTELPFARRALAISGAALALAAAGCSTDASHSTDTTVSVNPTASNVTSLAAAPSEAPATGGSAKVETAGGVTLEASPATNLHDGDEITVTITGLDPKLGYYAAICAPERPAGSPVPLCTGGRGDATAQAWIKAEGGTATLNNDGSATATIAVSPVGDGVNCHEQDCVLKVFGDHTEGFKDVEQVPVIFAK